MSNELNQEADHAEFEAAYQKEFPVSASLMMDKFDRDEHGDYKENCVYTAYHLWQAARRASAPAAADVALPELPRPAHRGPDGTGSYFDSYTREQVEQIRREAILADRQARAKSSEIEVESPETRMVAAFGRARQSSAVGMEPVYQAYAGSEGWFDIEEADIESYQSMNLPIRTLYAAPALADAPQAKSNAQVGCERYDGLLNIHAESEKCEVCAKSTAAQPVEQTQKGQTK